MARTRKWVATAVPPRLAHSIVAGWAAAYMQAAPTATHGVAESYAGEASRVTDTSRRAATTARCPSALAAYTASGARMAVVHAHERPALKASGRALQACHDVEFRTKVHMFKRSWPLALDRCDAEQAARQEAKTLCKGSVPTHRMLGLVPQSLPQAC